MNKKQNKIKKSDLIIRTKRGLRIQMNVFADVNDGHLHMTFPNDLGLPNKVSYHFCLPKDSPLVNFLKEVMLFYHPNDDEEPEDLLVDEEVANEPGEPG